MEITRETVLLKHEHEGEEVAKDLVEQGGNLLTQNEALGGLSLIFWALIFLSIKYDLLVMRADNRGEGGEFALWSLLKASTTKIFGLGLISFFVVTAAGLLAADGVITPPMSMLGAFEPLGPELSVLVTLGCLIFLFKVQWRGTSRVGSLFGWFMIAVWFPWIALKGAPWIAASPEVFYAVNPIYAIQFLTSFPGLGFMVILGVVVLAITGGEAKYADIGHFSISSGKDAIEGQSLAKQNSGRVPVMYSWVFVVLPSLLICYAGQVGYLLEKGVPPRCNTFYAITPQFGIGWLDHTIHYVDIAIAAVAAIIASQALITGLFSIVKQATVLGFIPRFRVFHTDEHGEGQVYIPAVNWSLFLGCVVVTLMFQSAGNLAAAYGVAVTGSMGITTCIFGYVAYYRWNWKLPLILLICTPILILDLLFFTSNLLKIAHGGYFPIAIATGLILVMLTWRWGRSELSKAFYNFGVKEGKKVEWLVALRDMVDELEMTIRENLPAARQLIQGRRRLVESDRAAVFLCSRPIESTEDYVPVNLRIFLKKYGVLPSHIILLHVNQASVAEIPRQQRYRVKRLGNDIDSVTLSYGYMEEPDIRRGLKVMQKRGLINIHAERWIIEVGEEEIIISEKLSGFQKLRCAFFAWLLRMSTPAHKYLGLFYDAAVSKEVIPVVFDPQGTRIALPELELVQPGETPPKK